MELHADALPPSPQREINLSAEYYGLTRDEFMALVRSHPDYLRNVAASLQDISLRPRYAGAKAYFVRIFKIL